VVLNRPGAGGTIGVNAAAKSEPDGHTVVIISASISSFPLLYKSLPFDISEDLTYLGLGASLPLGLSVNPELPMKTVADVVAHAKANPGKLTYASAGNGTLVNLGAELFKSMADIDILHVPYKGSAAAVLATVGGETDLIFDTVFIQSPQVNAGKLRLLATGSEARTQSFPDVPTFAETYPGYNVVSWLGFAGPADLPPDVVEKWSREIARITALPEIIQRFRASGQQPLTVTPKELHDIVQNDMAQWKKVILDANIPQIE